MNSSEIIQKLRGLANEDQRQKYESTLNLNLDNTKLGVPMGEAFSLAKKNIELANEEIITLLRNSIHEAKVVGVSVMDFQARSKRTSEEQRKWLYEAYINNHAYINSWDLIDRAVQHVVGGYLYEYSRPRKILYDLAKSKEWTERRSAIVATLYFIRQADVNDTFKLAETLLSDREDLIHKAVGGVLREAGKKEPDKLKAFLDLHTTHMPAVMLRYATEKMSHKEKRGYRDRNRLAQK